jgi:hypothetical protein
VRAAALFVIAACGRIDFDGKAPRDAALDTACTFGAFSTPAPLPAVLQSTDDDWAATPTLGGKQLFFFSYRAGGAGSSDIWQSTQAGGAFGTPVRVAELDTPGSETAMTLTDDALDIVFGRDGDLYEATRPSAGGMFGAATALAINSTTADGDPFLSADGLRLVFASSRIGPDQHGLDLFETTRPARTAEFAMPVELHELNSDNDDSSPTLSADGLEIFFASRRPSVTSPADIYTARRPAIDQPFGAPVVVPELSSTRDDVLPRLSRDGATIYLNYNTVTQGGANADLDSAVRSCN